MTFLRKIAVLAFLSAGLIGAVPVSADPTELLRLTARSEFDAAPPPEVAQWLEARGVTF